MCRRKAANDSDNIIRQLFIMNKGKRKRVILTGLYSIIYSVSEREIKHKRIVRVKNKIFHTQEWGLR